MFKFDDMDSKLTWSDKTCVHGMREYDCTTAFPMNCDDFFNTFDSLNPFNDNIDYVDLFNIIADINNELNINIGIVPKPENNFYLVFLNKIFITFAEYTIFIHKLSPLLKSSTLSEQLMSEFLKH